MIFVFSNRNLIKNDTWLGDDFNTNSNEEIRVARYNSSRRPALNFYTEEEGSPPPSEAVLDEIEASAKPCCIFLHGYNQSLKKNLAKCEEIENYGVNVIAFSWPSNPGPNWWPPKEYRVARQNARRSAVALERFFDKLSDFIESTGSINNLRTLVVHSLGNHVLETFVRSPGFNGQTRFLKNILLHQADADSEGHERWADKMAANSRVMATINETDNVLDFADVVTPDRLGNTLANLHSSKLTYFNFGKIKEARDEHRLWVPSVARNRKVESFFKSAFTGKKIETSNMKYDRGRNCYHI